MIGLVGRKIGMSRIFMETGEVVPVSVIEVLPHHVTQVKTQEKEGFRAVQVTTGTQKRSRVTKPLKGHFVKAGVEAGRGLWEFRLPGENEHSYQAGQVLSLGDLFQVGQYVDVRGSSRGKGFAGAVKRHNFRTQDATHGNSLSHRAPGSIGQNQTPGRVFKGKKMAGHMGNACVAVLNLRIIRMEEHLLLLSGAVPGHPGSDLIITPAVKKAPVTIGAAAPAA